MYMLFQGISCICQLLCCLFSSQWLRLWLKWERVLVMQVRLMGRLLICLIMVLSMFMVRIVVISVGMFQLNGQIVDNVSSIVQQIRIGVVWCLLKYVSIIFSVLLMMKLVRVMFSCISLLKLFLFSDIVRCVVLLFMKEMKLLVVRKLMVLVMFVSIDSLVIRLSLICLCVCCK